MNSGEGGPSSGFPEAARSLLGSLAALPYENLSKIAAFHRGGRPETAQDISARWLDDAVRTGVGGTCFSLTWWLQRRLGALGFSTGFLMADKPAPPWMSPEQAAGRAQANVHCGLLFEFAGRLYLLDPGYLIYEPLPLPSAGLSVSTFASPNEIRVDDSPAAGAWSLHTGPRGALKHRFDFRKEPVAESEFLEHWEASHRWEMMGYPVLNRVIGGTQYYLQRNNLLTRTAEAGAMRKLDDAEVRAAAREVFGLPRELVDEAMDLLKSGIKK